MKLLLSSIFLFFLFIYNVNSQVNFEKRIEIELVDGYESEEIYEFGELGFIKSSRTKRSDKGEYEWRFDLYSTDLELKEEKSVYLPKEFKFDEVFVDEAKLYFLFTSRKIARLLVLDVFSMKDSFVDIEVAKKSYIQDMQVMGGRAYFASSLKKAPYLFSVDVETGEQDYIPVRIGNYKSKRTSIERFQVLEEENEIIVYTQAYVKKGVFDYYAVRIDQKGKIIETIDFNKNVEMNLIDMSASKVGEEHFIFTGTYSKKSASSSEGVFICEVRDGDLMYINYVNYLDLENFLSYLPEKKQDKIERKKKRKGKKGKELTISYRLAIHDIIEIDGGYMFLGEAYYPTYRTETTTTFVNGQQQVITTRVFDGYYYTHALVAKFDKDGNMIWDRTFELRPSNKPFYVKRFISIIENQSNSLDMIFPSFDDVVFKSIASNGDVIVDRERQEMDSSIEGDEVKYSSTEMLYWYDNFFITYGAQRIKNKEDDSVKRKRRVFFISKLRYDP